ncbi:MAG: hypothetical protein ACRD3N_10590 [Terracidiphilus sp.]
MKLHSCPPKLAGVLRTTLDQLERAEEIDAGDPALIELKRSIARTIAELEVVKASKIDPGSDPSISEPA